MNYALFAPENTASVLADTTSQPLELGNGDKKGRTVMVTNASQDFVAYIQFGSENTVVATVAQGIPILPATSQLFRVKPAFTWVAAITPTGTARISFTDGNGDV